MKIPFSRQKKSTNNTPPSRSEKFPLFAIILYGIAAVSLILYMSFSLLLPIQGWACRFSPCRQCPFYFQKKGVFEMDFWSYLGSSVAGGGIGSLLVGWWLKRREKEHDELYGEGAEKAKARQERKEARQAKKANKKAE